MSLAWHFNGGFRRGRVCLCRTGSKQLRSPFDQVRLPGHVCIPHRKGFRQSGVYSARTARTPSSTARKSSREIGQAIADRGFLSVGYFA